MTRFQSVSRLELGSAAPLSFERPITVERSRGASGGCCGCGGSASIRDTRTIDGRFWVGTALLLTALAAAILLLLVAWGMEFDQMLIQDSASGEAGGSLERGSGF